MDRLDALKIFCNVVEAGGFNKAAERMGISATSVTNHISLLETRFDIKLLNRTTRSMSLTEAGRQCYEQALHLLSDMSELESNLTQSTLKPSGSLRIDMPSVISRLYVAPALARFIADYPDLALKITVRDNLIDMVEEGIDVLIRIGQLQSSNLIAKRVCTTRYICCASPQYLQQNGWPDTPETLAEFTCLSFLNPKSRQVRPWFFEHQQEKFNYIPKAAVAMDHVESLIEAAKAGGGIIQHMSISLMPSLRAGLLVPILEQWSTPGPDVSVLYQQKNHQPAKIKAFVEFIQELLHQQV